MRVKLLRSNSQMIIFIALAVVAAKNFREDLVPAA